MVEQMERALGGYEKIAKHAVSAEAPPPSWPGSTTNPSRCSTPSRADDLYGAEFDSLKQKALAQADGGDPANRPRSNSTRDEHHAGLSRGTRYRHRTRPV